MSREDDALRLLGTTHRLEALPVDGERWVGMIVVESPGANAAMLTLDHATQLRDWLTRMIESASQPCPCGHSETYHNQGECLVCEPERCQR